jgi:hypothetical protein
MTEAEQMECDELGRFTYRDRCDHVYRGGAKACRAAGPHHARCVRLPGHKGFCEGQGFDEWGPRYECWLRKGAERGTPLPLDRRLA